MKIYQNSFPGKDVTKAFVCFCLSLAFFPIFSFGQTNLPEGLKFKMVFDEKTLHYTALFDEADLSRLSAMDKAMFQRYSEERSVETRIDLNNDVYTNITIAHPQAPAGMTPIAKMSIDKTGVRLYDVAGNQTLHQEEPAEYNNLLRVAGSTMAAGESLAFPSPSEAAALAAQWQSDGYTPQTLSGNKLMVQKDGHSISWDFMARSTEEKFSENGTLKQSIRTVFGLLPGGESVPVFKENVYFEVFPCGVCYKMVDVTRFSNYTVQRAPLQERTLSTQNQSTTGALFIEKVAPNPAAGQFALRAAFPEEGKATILLLDLHGRTVWQEEVWGTPEFAQLFDVQAVEPGVYMLELRQGRHRAQQRLLKM